MKIALVNTVTPFVRGGAEILVDDLYEQLRERGHQVTLFRLPFPNNYAVVLIELVLSAKLMDFSSYDKVIAFKFPAYCVYHRHKTLWMFHQFRQVYDLFGNKDGLPDTVATRAMKEIVTQIDNDEIGNAERVYVNADEVRKRLAHYNGITSEILTPPLLNAEQYHFEKTGDYIYYPSRVTSLKRQHLAIEAMRYVKTDAKLIVAGRCVSEEYENRLRGIIKEYKLQNRVFYENKWVEDDEKIKMLSNCLAVLYIPYLEDSCGFVSFEAFCSGKPVISCVDSGGTKEVIRDEFNGFMVEPTPQALAERIDYLFANRETAKRMGENAQKWFVESNISWDRTVEKLLI